VSLILLVIMAFTVLAPATSFTLMTVDDGRSFLGNLDVCHSAAPALSSNGEMPCIGLTPCSAAPALAISFSEPFHPVYTELILASSNEHPPRS
jgi:hypothetical protein